MMLRKWTHEHLLYGLALGLALCFRLIWLDVPPLSNAEAGWALQALALSRDKMALIGAQPGYILLTSQIFRFFLDSNFLARFWPALAGGLLAVAPFYYRRWLGRAPALILAFGLALDPGLVALSRQAGGPAPAVTFVLLAVGAWFSGRPVWAGIFAGLAVLGGPILWPGLAVLALASVLTRFLMRRSGLADLSELSPAGPPPAEPRNDLRSAAAAAAATLLVVGALFFQAPRGISAIGDSLAAYLAGWTGPVGTSASIWVLTLLFYQPVAVILGVWGAARVFRGCSPGDRFMSLWLVFALLHGLVYPARGPADLIWVILPLWGLAAHEIVRHLNLDAEQLVPTLGVASLTVIILTFESMNLARLVTDLSAQLPNQAYPQFWLTIVAGLALLVFIVYLVAWGWSFQASGRGFLWGLLVVLSVYTLSNVTYSAGMRVPPTAELWESAPIPRDIDLLANTVRDLSRWNSGQPNQLDIVVSGIDSSALQWALRFAPRYERVPSLPGGIRSPIVITPADEQQPSLASTYRGQSILLSVSPDWEAMNSLDWLNWLIYRNSPEGARKVILWARTDLFPGGAPATGSAQVP